MNAAIENLKKTLERLTPETWNTRGYYKGGKACLLGHFSDASGCDRVYDAEGAFPNYDCLVKKPGFRYLVKALPISHLTMERDIGLFYLWQFNDHSKDVGPVRELVERAIKLAEVDKNFQ